MSRTPDPLLARMNRLTREAYLAAQALRRLYSLPAERPGWERALEADRLPSRRIRPLEYAETTLRRVLSAGPRPAAGLIPFFAARGISRRTLFRAKSRLGVVSRRQGYSGGIWRWSLPPNLLPKVGTLQGSSSPPASDSLPIFGTLQQPPASSRPDRPNPLPDSGTLRDPQLRPMPNPLPDFGTLRVAEALPSVPNKNEKENEKENEAEGSGAKRKEEDFGGVRAC